jgi:5-methylcytosine-specific restriction endonuclease McrA
MPGAYDPNCPEPGIGPNGRRLCRWCDTEVPPGRRKTFCSQACVDEWMVRTSSDYARRKVLERDHGVCAICGIDTLAVHTAYYEFDLAQDHESAAFNQFRSSNGFPTDPVKSLWQADHITPVVRGGGRCGLENLRTLCIWCHRRETAALARKRALERRRNAAQGELL